MNPVAESTNGDKAHVGGTTVVVPCFNHGEFVAEAVRSCVNQTGGVAVRVVVVDDGSDDGTSAAACDACAALGPGISVIHQANRGVGAARNRGAAEAAKFGPEAGYLVFLDADDWIEPEFVSRLTARMGEELNGAVSHAYCQERLVGQGSGVWRVPEWDPVLLLVTNLHPVTALVRRDRFEAVGGFDETMRSGYEDWDLWLRFAERGWSGARVREPLFNWRRHSDGTMVMEAVPRHKELFSQILDRHAWMYAAKAKDVILLSNVLLRRADANWLDETGESIVVRDLKAWNADLLMERDLAIDEASRLAAQIEGKPSNRAIRVIRRMVDALPGPVSAPVRAAARALKRGLMDPQEP